MGFLPIGKLSRVLLPVDEGSLIAHGQKGGHGFPMRAAHHEGSHGSLVLPASAGPEGPARVVQQIYAEVSGSAAGLARGGNRAEEERREVAQGSDAQARYGDDRHWLSLIQYGGFAPARPQMRK